MKHENFEKYIKQEVEELKKMSLGTFYTRIKKIGARIGECEKSSFSIQSHVEQNLDPEAAAEKIAQHFSAISKEYPPMEAASLPQRVKDKIFQHISPASLHPFTETTG